MSMTRFASGNSSRSSSRRLPPRFCASNAKPVRLEPGCDRLDTTPSMSGSPVTKMTGTVVVAAFTARIVGGPPVENMRSGFKRENVLDHPRQPLDAAIAPAKIDDQVAAFDIAQLAQALAEGRDVCRHLPPPDRR